MNWSNYDDVLRQITGAGLIVTSLEVGRRQRCRVEGYDKEKRGWYHLHELRLDDGTEVLVGSYGIWQGNNPNSVKVELKKGTDLSADQRAAIKARIAADRKAEDARRRAEANRAARRATAAWSKLLTEGDSDYLRRKCVLPHGVRYSPAGTLVVPVMDAGGLIHGLQLIYASNHPRRKRLGRDKEYWPAGMSTQGHFFLIGSPTMGAACLVAEGYATAATLHEATGLPVAVAFDAGNLVHVATALRTRWAGLRILLCADDDYLGKCRECGKLTLTGQTLCTHCGKPAGITNAGATAASSAALAVSGAWVYPRFAIERPLDQKGATDFNDLHVAEGLQVVRAQIDAALAGLKWTGRPQAAPTLASQGGGAGEALCSISSLEELHARYSLVYEASDMVFDAQEHVLVPLASMRNLCTSRQLHRNWMESLDKRVVRLREVGFDPTEADESVKCNLYGGWPTTPRAGNCEKLLELGEYLCSQDPRGSEMWRWLQSWLAYPIQHPGAKMKTAVIMHGPQGTGKNLFFGAILRIYGEYGAIVDQDALEDKHNDFMSRKLMLVGDEVVTRGELYHAKNKLKVLIDGEWIRINPKHLASYRERNHCQIVLLSNEVQPSALERDDRRHAVIWTPPKLEGAFYNAILREIEAGGVAALHQHLLEVPLGDFSPGTLPPMTEAKKDLIELGLDSSERFYNEWIGDSTGSLLPLRRQSCRSMDLYAAYRHWCSLQGVGKPAQLSTFVGAITKRPGVDKKRCWHFKNYSLQTTMQSEVITPPGAVRPDDRAALAGLINGFAESLQTWREETSVQHAPRGKGGPAKEPSAPAPAGDDDDGPF